MSGVTLEQLKIFVGEALEVIRQLAIVVPEFRVGEMLQSSVQCPALKSASACAARWSSLPAVTSAANFCSHASASNSRNQWRNAAKSCAGSFLTACSIS